VSRRKHAVKYRVADRPAGGVVEALQSKWQAPGGNGAGNKMPTGLRNEEMQ